MTQEIFPVGTTVQYCFDNPSWKRLHGSLGVITEVLLNSPYIQYSIDWDPNSPMGRYQEERGQQRLEIYKWYFDYCVRRYEPLIEYDPKQNGDTEEDI